MSILDELNEVFQEVKDDTGGFKSLPLGTYTGIVTDKTEYVEENSKGLPMVKFVVAVVGGEHDAELHFANFNLSHQTPKIVPIMQSMFAQFANSLGLDTSKGLKSTVHQVIDFAGREIVFELSENAKNPDFPRFKVLEVK